MDLARLWCVPYALPYVSYQTSSIYGVGVLCVKHILNPHIVITLSSKSKNHVITYTYSMQVMAHVGQSAKQRHAILSWQQTETAPIRITIPPTNEMSPPPINAIYTFPGRVIFPILGVTAGHSLSQLPLLLDIRFVYSYLYQLR